MKKRKYISLVLVLMMISLLFVVSSESFVGRGVRSFSEFLLSPFIKIFVRQEQKRDTSHEDLVKKFVDQKKLERENRALLDQFQTTTIKSSRLIPAKIVGYKDEFVIDRGQKDGVTVGQVVVFKDNLVGRIIKTTDNYSKVQLVYNKETSLAARTQTSGSVGIVEGNGNDQSTLGNVLLSDTLRTQDIVVTQGDLDENGQGLPADLVIGKITSVDKKPSALFQTARVSSLIDFSKLHMVFVISK